LNNGICAQNVVNGVFNCTCAPGWSGTYCQSTLANFNNFGKHLDYYLGNVSNIRALKPAKFSKSATGQMYDINIGLVETVQTVVHCQLKCQKYTNCNSFSFGKVDGKCRPVVAANASLTSASDHDVYDFRWIED
jgi:hypothetical protein